MDFDELDELHNLTEERAAEDAAAPASDFEDEIIEDLHEVVTNPSAPTDDATKDQGSSDVKLTGIEKYLAQFDIEGGMITFDDGTTKHFNELDEDKQAEILGELHSSSTSEIEAKYGLDQNEITIINYLRENNTTIDAVIGEMVEQRVQAVLALQSTGSIDYDKMEEDAVYMAFLTQGNPEATSEQLEKDLATAKQMSTYSKSVSTIRESLKRDQAHSISASVAEKRKAMETELEDQRKTVVTAVSKMTEVDGFRVDDSMKNSVLDIILSVDEDGDSKFMTDVFSDPNKLFKAAWWYTNGADVLAQREEYWKREKSEAFKRGQTTQGKQTFSSAQTTNKDKTTPPVRGSGERSISSIDEIYE